MKFIEFFYNEFIGRFGGIDYTNTNFYIDRLEIKANFHDDIISKISEKYVAAYFNGDISEGEAENIAFKISKIFNDEIDIILNVENNKITGFKLYNETSDLDFIINKFALKVATKCRLKQY